MEKIMPADYSNIVCLSKYRKEKEEREFQEYIDFLQEVLKYYAEESHHDVVDCILLSLEEHLSGRRNLL
jgi:hypothetical protein